MGIAGVPADRLLIMIYHRVHPEPDPLFPGEPTAESFGWQMELLARFARPVGLAEGVRRLCEGTLPPRAVAVTFDDGYADNSSIAAPILRAAGVPATFFVATAFLDEGRMWNDTVIESVRRARGPMLDVRELGIEGPLSVRDMRDRREAARMILTSIKHRPQEERERTAQQIADLVGSSLPKHLMMSSDEVRRLAESGMTIGAHTVTHPILRVLARERAYSEIRDSKCFLERLTGQPVTLFAYPNGRRGDDYAEEHVEIVRQLGFEAAVSTDRGVAHRASDILQLPRFTPWDRSPARFLGRLLAEYRSAA
jgi:peptidoglycan/xylan/chitin deacetylase (PgdA/CDA1 family)